MGSNGSNTDFWPTREPISAQKSLTSSVHRWEGYTTYLQYQNAAASRITSVAMTVSLRYSFDSTVTYGSAVMLSMLGSNQGANCDSRYSIQAKTGG